MNRPISIVSMLCAGLGGCSSAGVVGVSLEEARGSPDAAAAVAPEPTVVMDDSNTHDASDASPLGNADDLGRDASTPLEAESSSPECACYAGDGLYCAQGVIAHGGAHSCSSTVAAAHPHDVLRC